MAKKTALIKSNKATKRGGVPALIPPMKVAELPDTTMECVEEFKRRVPEIAERISSIDSIRYSLERRLRALDHDRKLFEAAYKSTREYREYASTVANITRVKESIRGLQEEHHALDALLASKIPDLDLTTEEKVASYYATDLKRLSAGENEELRNG
ncbi:MAG: hypothetical protein M5R41_10455 [Bacteroidia bacterium]|nr:hypothetical protein [Bacteroidia bacterium]